MRRGATRTEMLLAVMAAAFVINLGVNAYRIAVPVPAPESAPVVASDPELVIVIDSAGKRVQDAAIETAAAKLTVGQWTVQAIPKPGESGWTRTVVVSGGPVPPTPVPPGPTPPVPVPPEPGPPPVVEGKRALLIVRESGADTPALGRLINGLRNQHAAYLISKGHELSFLDVNGEDETDQQAAAVKAWEPFFRDLQLPVLLIIDPATKQLVHRESLGPSATADSVVATLKGNGG